MGFLNNTSVTVDAVLTKKGRELLARGQDEFKITKFALADDEVDYRLWDTAHPNGSNYYGSVIENMPILESFVDENQIMRFKLVSLPKNTSKLPILEVPSPTLVFNGPGVTQVVSPNTRNGSDAEVGYSFTLHDATIANLTPVIESRPKRKKSRRRVPQFSLADIERNPALRFIQKELEEDIAEIAVNVGATTPVFLNEEERKRSITIQGKSINLVSRSVTADTSTNLTVTGLSTGATYNIAVTIKADPSTL
jgi:hypothetical protein